MYGLKVNLLKYQKALDPVWVDYSIAELIYTASKAAAFPSRQQVDDNFGNCGYSAISCYEYAQTLGLQNFHIICAEKGIFRDDYLIHWANCHFHTNHLIFIDASPYTSVYKVSKPIPLELVSEINGVYSIDTTNLSIFGLCEADIVFTQFSIDDNPRKLNKVMQATAKLRTDYDTLDNNTARKLMEPFIKDDDITYSLFAINELATYSKLREKYSDSLILLLNGLDKDNINTVLVRDIFRLINDQHVVIPGREEIQIRCHENLNKYFTKMTELISVLIASDIDAWINTKRIIESHRSYVEPIYGSPLDTKSINFDQQINDRKYSITTKNSTNSIRSYKVSNLKDDYRRAVIILFPEISNDIDISDVEFNEFSQVQSSMIYYLLEQRIKDLPLQTFEYRPYL